MNRFAAEPYPGVRPFQRRDRDRFFGRATEADILVDLWRTNHLTILSGSTGTGKSSLLAAAVIPQLAEDDLDVLPVGRLLTGRTHPRAALPAHNPFTLAVLRSWSPAETPAGLAGMSVQHFVSRRAERHGGTVFAAIDQAEELFVSSEARRRSHSLLFLRELNDALRSLRVHLLVSVREPAADQLTAELGPAARYQLTPLTRSRARDAVIRPVLRRTHRSYVAGAAEKLVQHLTTGTVETRNGQERAIDLDRVDPVVLQVACAHLWAALPANLDVITERDIRRYGDVDAALATYCGELIATVAADHDMPAGHLQAWLVRTFITERGTRGAACEGLIDTAGVPNAVLRSLEDRHLLSTERRSGSTWYQLLSDRLTGPLQRAADALPPPAEPASCLRAASRALAVGEFELARSWAEEAVRTAPGTDRRIRAEAQSLLGNIEFEQDRPAEAEGHYRAAARLFEAVRDTPAVAAQLAAAGQMLLAQGEVASAVETLRAAADRAPHDLTVQTELGWALWSLGQRRAAIAVLTDVLAIDGGDAEALRVRGEILADLGDARSALRDLDRVIQGERPSTRAARGLARTKLGEPGADKEIEEALEDAPHNGAVLLYAARAKELVGDKSAAMRLARYALNATDPALPQHQRAAAEELVGPVAPDGP
jgi:tetratricopeptide (TPR) repeat protein